MSKHSLVICFNALENRFFEVSAIHKVEHLYRLNFYRLSLRLKFYENDIDLSHIDEMRKLCFRQITKLMTVQNMWPNHHSFYVVDYEIRTIARNPVNQQNNNESNDRREDESESSNYTEETSSNSNSDDSAYISPPSVATTTTSNNSSISSAYSSSWELLLWLPTVHIHKC